jgi:malonyl-CoA O-methyltransferase
VSSEFTIDKAQLRRSFDRAAATYDRVAVLQREVCDRMFERLDLVRLSPRLILDAGSGTGYGARLLRKRYPAAEVIELDLALGMLKASRGHGAGWRRLLPFLSPARGRWVCGDIERLPLSAGSVDLVWSNLAFQWCNDIDAVFAEAGRALRPEGLLMFSTFGPDTLKELREAFGSRDGYAHVNRFMDMHDLGDALVKAGFSAPVLDMEHLTLTYDDLSGLLRDLKALGAHNVNRGRSRGLFGKNAWRAMTERYEGLRREGKLPATYEVVYGHAWRGEAVTPGPLGPARVIPLIPRR